MRSTRVVYPPISVGGYRRIPITLFQGVFHPQIEAPDCYNHKPIRDECIVCHRRFQIRKKHNKTEQSSCIPNKKLSGIHEDTIRSFHTFNPISWVCLIHGTAK